jgi:hemerythrin-like domain-containing protein
MMNGMPPHCGSLMFQGKSQVALCEPLAQLAREHEPLTEQMNAFAREAESIGEEAREDWTGPLNELRAKVEAFAHDLDVHSDKEEVHLFPLMAKYIGRETGPIAVMEYEHETGKQLIARFLDQVSSLSGITPADKAREIASIALNAREILTSHFMKEENVLFPMAETMLNAEEKERLRRGIME